MVVDQNSVSKIIAVLSHPLRREILILLSDRGECSFTDLLNVLKVDTGKLSFHLRTLSVFIEQTSTGKYKLSRTGENAVRVINDVESWAEVADVNKKATQLPLASFGKRTIAFIVDFFLTLTITLLFTVPQVVSILRGNVFSPELSMVLFITLGLLWVYSMLLEGFNGQSLGKRLAGLKAVRTDGKKLSYDHAAIRNFGKAFLLPFDVIVGLRLKNKEFIRYFDKFAGTTVINLRLQA
ncbi:RDD family protein [Candidatus Bathyarchaeota archaeon]|nr:RDD family protein [Candidatus Bathyarchaeota archaeon]